MPNWFKLTATVVALCLLAACLGLLITANLSGLEPRIHAQPPYRDQQEAAERQRIAEQVPAFADLIFGRNLQGYAGYCNAQTENEMAKWVRDYRCGVKITDVVAAASAAITGIFTLGLLGVGFLQWRVIRQQAKIMQQQGELTIAVQRAFIVFQQINPGVSVRGEAPPLALAAFVFRNSGSTPAIDCELVHELRIVNSDEPMPTFSRDELAIKEPRAASIGPGTSFNSAWMPMEKTDIDAIAARTKHAYIWCLITYRDAFVVGIPRKTEVCLRLVIIAPAGDDLKAYSDVSRWMVVGPQNKST